MPPQVRVHNFSFTYQGAAVPALDAVTFDVAGPALVSLIGEAGSGRTSLLRAVAGLLGEVYPGTATGGNEIDSADGTPVVQRRHLAVSAYFEAESQLTLMTETVADEISAAIVSRGASALSAAKRATEVAEELRMEHLLSRRVTELSGGEEKLVGLAACLAAGTPVFVLDEPFEQLDPRHVLLVLKALRTRVRAGALAIMATSLVDLAVNSSDALLVHAGSAWTLSREVGYAALSGCSQNSVVQTLLPARNGVSAHGLRNFRDMAQAMR